MLVNSLDVRVERALGSLLALTFSEARVLVNNCIDVYFVEDHLRNPSDHEVDILCICMGENDVVLPIISEIASHTEVCVSDVFWVLGRLGL